MSSFNYSALETKEAKLLGKHDISVKPSGSDIMSKVGHSAVLTTTQTSAIPTLVDENAMAPQPTEQPSVSIENPQTESNQPVAGNAVVDQNAVNNHAIENPVQPTVANNQPAISIDMPQEPVSVGGVTFNPAPTDVVGTDIVNPFVADGATPTVNESPAVTVNENPVPSLANDTVAAPAPTTQDASAIENPVSAQSAPVTVADNNVSDMIPPISLDPAVTATEPVDVTNTLSDEELVRQLKDLLDRSSIKQNEIKKMMMSHFNADLFMAKVLDQVERINVQSADLATTTRNLAFANQQQMREQGISVVPTTNPAPVATNVTAENQGPVLQKAA